MVSVVVSHVNESTSIKLNLEPIAGRIEIEGPHVFIKNHEKIITVILPCIWFQNSGFPQDSIVNTVIGSPWKKQGTFEDAKCSQCCKLGSPVVGLKFLRKSPINDGKEIVFNFVATSRCSSSRTHMGCSVILVVSGIPGLKPMLSAPISLQARLTVPSLLLSKKPANKPLNTPPTDLVLQNIIQPHNALVQADSCTIPCSSEYSYIVRAAPKYLQVVDSRSVITTLKTGVLATSSTTTAIFPASTASMLRGPIQTSVWITRPVILVGIVKTTISQLISPVLSNIIGKGVAFVIQLSDTTFMVGAKADSPQKLHETGRTLGNFCRVGNPFGYNLFLPNPYAHIVGWASNLYF